MMPQDQNLRHFETQQIGCVTEETKHNASCSEIAAGVEQQAHGAFKGMNNARELILSSYAYIWG